MHIYIHMYIWFILDAFFWTPVTHIKAIWIDLFMNFIFILILPWALSLHFLFMMIPKYTYWLYISRSQFQIYCLMSTVYFDFSIDGYLCTKISFSYLSDSSLECLNYFPVRWCAAVAFSIEDILLTIDIIDATCYISSAFLDDCPTYKAEITRRLILSNDIYIYLPHCLLKLKSHIHLIKLGLWCVWIYQYVGLQSIIVQYYQCHVLVAFT